MTFEEEIIVWILFWGGSATLFSIFWIINIILTDKKWKKKKITS
jgi:hypothetical protein